MNKTMTTKEKLLSAAKELFWTRGYSNVSVRDITKLAGVDVALVSRHFGGKLGLFNATLVQIPRWPALDAAPGDVVEAAVAGFAEPFDPDTEQANAFSMLLTNINDPEIGDQIRDLVRSELADPLAAKLGGDRPEDRAAMLMAALFGMALMRKNFQLNALAGKSPEDIRRQIDHLARAAIAFNG